MQHMNQQNDIPSKDIDAVARECYPHVMRAPMTADELLIAALKLPGKGIMAGMYDEIRKDGNSYDFLEKAAAAQGITTEKFIRRNQSRLERTDSDSELIDRLAYEIIVNAITQEQETVDELRAENVGRIKEGKHERKIPRKNTVSHWVSMLEPYGELRRKNPTMYDAANRKVARVLAAIGMSNAFPESTITPHDGIFPSDEERTDETVFLDAMGRLLIEAGNNSTHAFATALGMPALNDVQLGALREMFRNFAETRPTENET